MSTVLMGSADVDPHAEHGYLCCPDCGLLQKLPRTGIRGLNTYCGRCGATLERTRGRSINAALAMCLSALFLLLPMNLLPFLTVDIFGVHHTSIVYSGIAGIAAQGWPVVAVILALELIILPFFRFGFLATVLLGIYHDYHHPHLGKLFRWSERLDQWAMPDVFLIGCVIGYGRVAPFLPISIGIGGYCVLAVSFLTLLTRASLDRREIWRRIGPCCQHLEEGVEYVGCPFCGLPHPKAEAEGQPCRRCGERVWRYRPDTGIRVLALTLAGFFCYPFAYLYPMESNYQLGSLQGYTIMTGVHKLIQANFYVFAAIIFLASVLTPFLKLFGLSWFLISIHGHSQRWLRGKTMLFRVIRQIGRWSHIDVFTVAVFLPLMHLSGLLAVYVGKALPFFLAVVVITMFATEIFDPRLLWQKVDEQQEQDESVFVNTASAES
ncbi:paraquat-inducible protein A [Acidithiobacillus sp. CV18-2]|uniref:Paraquat-inducible protein A n=1 Tax=Igneacidithiobacillus copahuensis TaxID=2724909 RepID=A0AAE2YND6_9PROT|nr:paraquat-inducible protein A [Igneacidithiobacillus copahuensis]MBU2753982.1 paraquat-inducible protein A [Acidithiobacillus sp. CV18-3]MBU2756210.1 paraquat-inducible protein A [Acidithiobacillus sp. BN09-2]MBU2778655.1 paraquat-inducible protein A [Acidithiobacillus sp. CV18-2]MBU2797222.1 paraquat-inducible protein A [Acidithiobacillus sp. VAN18-2]MBU2798889.1 paraquat-inducible protein A [Acidithiobacillus sp. VAN18-4]UTV81430.1 paraquat-inducible protein A [Acidithiobacillus sp. YTS05